MKSYLDCFSCLLSQAINVARLTTDSENVQRQIINKVMQIFSKSALHVSPPEISQKVYAAIRQITKIDDPYYEAKQVQNKTALGLSDEFKTMISSANDQLFFSLKLAIAGNIIDLGIRQKLNDIKTSIMDAVNTPLSINDYSLFKKKIQHVKKLLYLGDNAGEIVFDKIFIEQIKKKYPIKVYYVVRGAPIINDVTLDDAKLVGMKDVAEVVSNKFDAPGTILSKCSKRIRRLLSESDMVISKGQGNYESLSSLEENIFFLLKAKCAIVARDLGVNEGDLILKSQIKNGVG